MLATLLKAAEQLARERGDPQVEAAHLVLAWAERSPGGALPGLGPATIARARSLLGSVSSTAGAQASPERPTRDVGLAIDVEELVRWVGGSAGAAVGSTGEDALAARLADGLTALIGAPSDAGRPAPPVVDLDLPPELLPQVELLAPGRVAVGSQTALDRALEVLAKRDAGTPCFVGPAGAGRTTALAAVATRLAERTAAAPGGAARTTPAIESVVRIRAAVVLGAGGAPALRELRDRLGGTHLLALDDLEVLLLLGASTTDHDLRATVRSVLARPDVPTIAALDRAFQQRLIDTEPQLAAGLTFVELPTLDADDRERVAAEQAQELEAHHAVRISPAALRIAAGPPGPDDRRVHPGLLVQRLDRACVKVRARGEAEVTGADVSVGSVGSGWTAIDAEDLTSRLAARIVGQDDVLERIARRLALTSLSLDLRPNRPNGVFLLAGPTGVGKTAIAQALAASVFDDEDRIIRLDLSEYAERHTVSRLTGPPPGYLGSDEPEGWLTTRVAQRPVSVVLLDEIEKAHPNVWNVFLQVFDDGRLTDAHGKEVSFSETVVLATSNLGARAFSDRAVGFLSGSTDVAADAARSVRSAIEATLPPELVNRFDDLLVCRPLGETSIASIARLHLTSACTRLAELGWRIELTEAAVALVARAGYDPAYGARHLQRNVEQHVLEGVVGRAKGRYEVDAAPARDELVWQELR